MNYLCYELCYCIQRKEEMIWNNLENIPLNEYCWALYFEELALDRHKVYVEPHRISKLDTSGGKLTASPQTRKKSDVPAGKATERSRMFEHIPVGRKIKKL
jgi:hypothetical protein